jgi:hypothetical protein
VKNFTDRNLANIAILRCAVVQIGRFIAALDHEAHYNRETGGRPLKTTCHPQLPQPVCTKN